MNLACPIDSKDDSIQKVSAVVASGQSTGTFSGPTGGTVSYDGKSGSVSGYATLSGTSISNLSRLLASPPEPVKRGGLGLWWILIYIYVAPIVFVMPLLAPVILYVTIGMVSFAQTDKNSIAGIVYGVMMAGMFIGIWFVFFLLWRFLWNKDKTLKKQNEEKYLVEKPKWEKAMQKWNRLYYCHKHDVVFDPENNETCAPTSLKELLYQ